MSEEVEIETEEAEKIFEEIKKGNWERFLKFYLLYNKNSYHSTVLGIVFGKLIGDVLARDGEVEYVIGERNCHGIFPLFDGKGFINFEKAKEFADQYSEFIRKKARRMIFTISLLTLCLAKS